MKVFESAGDICQKHTALQRMVNEKKKPLTGKLYAAGNLWKKIKKPYEQTLIDVLGQFLK